jgi:cobyrinic acid a,c-diamide synthase
MIITCNVPRFTVAALKGGAGKTLLTVGLTAEIVNRGMAPAVFKKGPDYIDAGWLGLAARTSCYNLDAFLFEPSVVADSFVRRSSGKDIAVIEGNRGLFDGVDSSGSYSTAEMAKALNTPVVLIVDATKMTRTAAALVLGCKLLDPDLRFGGVVLNRVAGSRHEQVLRNSIEQAVGVPVIGAVPKLSVENFPQRHLGLLPLYEHPGASQFVKYAAELANKYVNIDLLFRIARLAGDANLEIQDGIKEEISKRYLGVRVGVLRDSAFQFYYPENLEALKNLGADLIELSALENRPLPELDALYIGGGFPETHAEKLAYNTVFKDSIRSHIIQGLPVYAECGGLMYLSRNLMVDDKVYPMVGIFQVDSILERRPQGHGYIKVLVTDLNPFYPVGTELTGHEFHYSYVTVNSEADLTYAFRILRGHGMDGLRDGLCRYNVLGTYLHVHALGAPLWADGLLRKAAAYRDSRRNQQMDSDQ